jgi:solute carrier family 30 (zinc transporter), member 1
VHELHIWRLDQKKSIASAHVVVSDDNVTNFMDNAKTIKECLHAYGIHSATLQPELSPARPSTAPDDATLTPDSVPSIAGSSIRRRRAAESACQIVCGNVCESLTCCATPLPQL